MISTELLLYFVITAQLQSINKAAIKLNITPPAVSHGLKRLEKDLGLTLFERSPQGVRLTSDGRALFPIAEDVLNTLKQFELSAQQLLQKAPQTHSLSSCILFGESSIFDLYLPGISQRIYTRFPNIDFVVANKPLKKTLQNIAQDSSAVAFLLVGNDVRQKIATSFPTILQKSIASYKLAILAKKNSKWTTPLLKNKDYLTLDEIAHLPYIATEWNSSANYTFQHILRQHHFNHLENFAPSLSVLHTLLEHDIGISLGIANTFRELERSSIGAVPLIGAEDLTLDYVFLYNQNLEPALAQILVDILQAVHTEISVDNTR